MKKTKFLVIALVLLALGLALLNLKLSYPSSAFAPYLGELASGLIVGGLLSLLFKVFDDGEQAKELRRLLKIHDSVDLSGLNQIICPPGKLDYTHFLEKNRVVEIVLNDGARWVSSNALALRGRFSTSGKKTKIYTLDPDGDFVAPLSKKLGTDPSVIRQKIRSTHKMIREEWAASSKRGEVVVLSLANYPTHNVFLGDDEVIVSLSVVSSGRFDVPKFFFKKNEEKCSLFDFVKGDMKALASEAREEFSERPAGRKGATGQRASGEVTSMLDSDGNPA